MAYPAMNKTYMQKKYNVTKCANRRTNKSVKYIAVHYTATEASAKNNCIYFSGGNRNASADYFIDRDGSIYKFNADCANYFTWHVGDGKGKYGITNANSIGIEVVSKGTEFTKAQKNSLRALVLAIMDDYGVKAENVVRHYDASRKICPKPYAGSKTKDKNWKALHAYITDKTFCDIIEIVDDFKPYLAKVTCSVLNIRSNPGTNATCKIVGTVKKNQVFTIVEEKDGWGRLKSGAGWISLAYVKKL